MYVNVFVDLGILSHFPLMLHSVCTVLLSPLQLQPLHLYDVLTLFFQQKIWHLLCVLF